MAILGMADVMGTNGLTSPLDQARDGAGKMSVSFASRRFATGMVATSAVGFLNDGSAWPFAFVVLISAIAAMMASIRDFFTKPRQNILLVDLLS